MTQDEIIEMARQAGFYVDEKCAINDGIETAADFSQELNVFAQLVAAKATEEANARANASWTLMCEKMVAFEREACAKLCEDGLNIATCLNALDDMEMWGEKFAKAIRARGQA